MVTASKLSAWFLWLGLYSFLGWAYEVALWRIDPGIWINRGFLFGPLCPIYGTGAMIALLLLYRRVSSIPLLFLAGVVMATGVEYITSFVLEQLFGLRWWDYSYLRFQINGRISLLGALVFGVLTVLLIRVMHPRVEALTHRLTDKTKVRAASILALLIAIDCCMTVAHLLANA
ncbi:MAG: putative ABC transporter permease [Oscillospiraceae bacterium]|nr:putative ABC transporter permease [Oscillospiraceae bacterium]